MCTLRKLCLSIKQFSVLTVSANSSSQHAPLAPWKMPSGLWRKKKKRERERQKTVSQSGVYFEWHVIALMFSLRIKWGAVSWRWIVCVCVTARREETYLLPKYSDSNSLTAFCQEPPPEKYPQKLKKNKVNEKHSLLQRKKSIHSRSRWIT